MSDTLHYFESGSRVTAVALPFVMEERLREWDSLRKAMIKERTISEVSPMPAGLLNALKTEQILDLLAWFENGAK